MSNDELLRPTLSGFTRAPALYTLRGFFLAAAFGGPLGAAIYAAANTWRLHRLAQDLPVIIAIAAAGFLIPNVLHNQGWLQVIGAYLGNSPRASYPLLMRAIGLLCFAAIYLMHRRFFRAAKVGSSKDLPGWVPGIAGALLGYLADFAFVRWLIAHH